MSKPETGCYGCRHADIDADGATCKLDGVRVWNPARGCKYRATKKPTNGDRIRAMSNQEIAESIGKWAYSQCRSCFPQEDLIKWLESEVQE